MSTSESKGIRVDRVIVAEPLPILSGKTIKLRCVYGLYGQDDVYKSEYMLDIAKPGKKRTIWVHKDEMVQTIGANSSYTR
jgi:hypothetical protein